MIPKAVLILSGKGGVGKTFISVNLALHLSEKGAKVGLLDADFSASNSGFFLDMSGEEMSLAEEKFHPVRYDGIEVFSLPLFLGEKSVSMTGDQYGQLLRDAVESTTWNAEYIIVDCPAGFGDELKTAAKVFENNLLGSIIVVQPSHELDARRALKLHKDLELPVLGLIENMSYFKAGAITYKIFGESVIDRLGEEFEVPVFGKIPLSMEIRKLVENKTPKLTEDMSGPIFMAVENILAAKPQKPGFISKLKGIIKSALEGLIIQLTLSINQEIDIPSIQEKFGYPGGSIIRMNIMDNDMNKIVTQTDWMVNQGKLTAVQGERYLVDAQIDITPKALKWAILQNKRTSDNTIYTFEDALRLGHMRVYGEKSMARGAYFMKYVFTELSQNQSAMLKLRPILEVL